MTRLILRKAKVKASPQDSKLAYFRKLILDHLDSLEDGDSLEKARGMPVGTIREWKGKKYVKTGSGKWKPKYDEHSRGAKMAIAAIKRKIAAAKDAQEMLRIVLENRDRFSGKDGLPLPFVQELSRYVGARQDNRGKTKEGENATKEVLKKKLEDMSVPMDIVVFNRENYDKLFPDGMVETPLGEVKLGDNQYEKLKERERTGLLGALKQTLTDPVVVYSSGGAEVYAKSFAKNGKIKAIVSVVVEKEGQRISISTHNKDLNNLVNAIKKGNILYEKDVAQKGGFHVHASKKRDNASAEATPNAGSSGGSLKTGGQDHPIIPSKEEATDAIQTVIASLPQSSPDSSEKSSGIEAIREKYQAAKAIVGDEDEIAVGKETITGRWKLVEADTPAASHNENTFHKTDGYPTGEDGSTINDRDYERDKAAQEAVLEIASDYDMQALSFDSPVVVTDDGIVISGNNRTMSSKIAAKKGTDTKYIDALKRRAKKFGFTPEQVGQFENPRVIFETDKNEGYSTRQFAKFNESGKKAMNPIESAVKVAKTIKPHTVESIAGKIGEFDTMGELYADKKAVNDIFSALQQGGILGQFDRPQYVTEDGITGAGKEFLETVLIGSVINESNIRGLNREGCKSIRQKLVRAITPLIENKGMDGYSITEELNKAVDIAMQVAINKDKFSNVEEYSKQKNMFEDNDRVSIELAKRMEGTQKDFADFMQTVNGGLKYAANGEADIFLGEVETKEAILDRIMKSGVIKKAVDGALAFFRRMAKGAFDESNIKRDECGRFSENGTKDSADTTDFDSWIGEGERLFDLTVSSEGATRAKAMQSLGALAGKELVNDETGIKAVINVGHRNKLLSGKAIGKSISNGFNARQHFAVSARIAKTWKHASLAGSSPDRYGDPNIAAIRRYIAPILLDGDSATAYMTVKESVEHGNRIYSLELQEILSPQSTRVRHSVAMKKSNPTPCGHPLAISGDSHLPTVSPSPLKKSSTKEALILWELKNSRK
jgi:hypothetical protein